MMLCPCGDSNTGICLRRAALYPLSYRGEVKGILPQLAARAGGRKLRRCSYPLTCGLSAASSDRRRAIIAAWPGSGPTRANWYFLKASSPHLS